MARLLANGEIIDQHVHFELVGIFTIFINLVIRGAWSRQSRVGYRAAVAT